MKTKYVLELTGLEALAVMGALSYSLITYPNASEQLINLLSDVLDALDEVAHEEMI